MKYENGKTLYRVGKDEKIVEVNIIPYYKVEGLKSGMGQYFNESELDEIIDKANLLEFEEIKQFKIKALEKELKIKLKEEK